MQFLVMLLNPLLYLINTINSIGVVKSSFSESSLVSYQPVPMQQLMQCQSMPQE
jgi:hypothetical protein